MCKEKQIWCTSCGCDFYECICNPGKHSPVEIESVVSTIEISEAEPNSDQYSDVSDYE